MRNVVRVEGLLEHRRDVVLDVRRRRCRVVKSSRSAILEVGGIRTILDVGVGVAVLVVGEIGIWILNSLIRDIKNRNRYSTGLHRLTIIGVVLAVGRDAGRRILIGRSAVGRPVLRAPAAARLSLVVLRPV